MNNWKVLFSFRIVINAIKNGYKITKIFQNSQVFSSKTIFCYPRIAFHLCEYGMEQWGVTGAKGGVAKTK